MDETYALWLGNETAKELTFEQCELCGFNLGQFEEKIVAGHLASLKLDMGAFFLLNSFWDYEALWSGWLTSVSCKEFLHYCFLKRLAMRHGRDRTEWHSMSLQHRPGTCGP